MRAIFRDHLDEPGAVAACERLAREVSTHTACLLCFEADPACCHREVLVDRLAERSPVDVVHLSPREGQ